MDSLPPTDPVPSNNMPLEAQSAIAASEPPQEKTLKKRRAKKKELLEDIDGDETMRSLLTVKGRRRLDGKKLKEQLLEAVEKNENLSRAIEEKNSEIAELQRSVDSLNDVLSSVPIEELRCNSSIASNKLMDLSKKNRSLQVQLEQTKSRLCKKECEVQKLEREIKTFEQKLEEMNDPKKKSSVIDELQSKVSALQQKVFETRNKNTELQNQLKIAQKLLQQEIGDSFNATNWATLHSMQPSWRGRAQQILHLQQREKELREKLEMFEQQMAGLPPNYGCRGDSSEIFLAPQNSKRSEGGKTAKSQISRVTLPSAHSTVTLDRFLPGAHQTQAQHRAKIESLQKQIADLTNDLDQANSKILALKVRNKTLSDELNKCRTNFCTQQQVDEYNSIMHSSTMMEKLNKQKMQYEVQMAELRQEFEKTLKERSEALYKEEVFRAKYEEAQELLANKDELIEELNEACKKAEADLRALCDGFLFSCRDFKKEEFIGVLDALEKEKNELVKLNKTLNERLTNERSKTEQISDQLSKAKIKISRLEAKIRELEKEIENLSERKKRAQRIADYASSITNLQTGRSVSSFTFENSNSLVPPSATITSRSRIVPELELEDVRNELQLANEKIVLLSEKLTYLTQEKENDAKMFESAISNTKNTLLETILEHKIEIKRPLSAIMSGKTSERSTDAMSVCDS